jgi:hypothetical protein
MGAILCSAPAGCRCEGLVKEGLVKERLVKERLVRRCVAMWMRRAAKAVLAGQLVFSLQLCLFLQLAVLAAVLAAGMALHCAALRGEAFVLVPTRLTGAQ